MAEMTAGGPTTRSSGGLESAFNGYPDCSSGKRAPSAICTRRARGESLVHGECRRLLGLWAKATRADVAKMVLRRKASVRDAVLLLVNYVYKRKALADAKRAT
jgi:hypothetical protein